MNKYIFSLILILSSFQLQAGKYNLYIGIKEQVTMFSTDILCGHDLMESKKAQTFKSHELGTFGEDFARGFYIVKGKFEAHQITYSVIEKAKPIDYRAFIKEDDILFIGNDSSDKSGLKVRIVSKKEFAEMILKGVRE